MDAVKRGAGAKRVEVVVAVIAKLAVRSDHRPLATPSDRLSVLRHHTNSVSSCESLATDLYSRDWGVWVQVRSENCHGAPWTAAHRVFTTRGTGPAGEVLRA